MQVNACYVLLERVAEKGRYVLFPVGRCRYRVMGIRLPVKLPASHLCDFVIRFCEQPGVKWRAPPPVAGGDGLGGIIVHGDGDAQIPQADSGEFVFLAGNGSHNAESFVFDGIIVSKFVATLDKHRHGIGALPAIVIMLLRIIIHCLQNAVRLSVREVQGFVGDAVGEDALAKHVETDMLQPRATVLHPESPVHLPDQVLGFHDADVLDPFRLRERIRIPCRHIQEQAAQGMRQAWQAVHTSNVPADAGAVDAPMPRHVLNQEPGSLQLQAVCRVLGVMCQHLF